MTRNPTISVVMSVYNGDRYLKEAISSILNQTYKDFEFIIINDGSTDGSGLIINEASKVDTRVRVFSQKNKGLVTSLNIGTSKARGTYLARMDADDISLPNRLEKQVKFMDDHPKVGLLGCGFIYIDEDDNETGKQGILTSDHDLKRELCLRNPFGHGSIMARLAAVKAAGGYSDLGPIEDYSLWTKIAANHKIAAVPEFLYKWRINPKGISQTQSEIQLKQSEQIAKDFRQSFDHDIDLGYLLKRKAFYHRLDKNSYLRFIEDQKLFYRIFSQENNQRQKFIYLIFILMTPRLIAWFFAGRTKLYISRINNLGKT